MRGVTHHMACTDTGLKTCDRPAVVTLKPLGEEEEEESEDQAVEVGGWRSAGRGGEGGRNHRLDSARPRSYSPVEHSSGIHGQC